MHKPKKNSSKESKANDAIGIMFITLGITMKTAGSWLFIVAGMLFLVQGLYDRRSAKQTKRK